MDSMIEPLAVSAPLAWAEAPRSCRRDAATGETCLYYHQVWQYLRLLGVITTVGTNSRFFDDTFREHGRTGDYGRVLVAGTADYAMLARLKSAYDAEAQPLAVTLLDRCATALFLNHWYADRVGLAIDSKHGDALEYSTAEPFDLICTHNFLGRFDRDGRQRLIDVWRSLLRPGGLVVTTLRVRPQSLDARVVYSEDQARTFGAKVSAIARSQNVPLAVSAEELGNVAYEYAKRKDSYVITSNNDVTDMFEALGFEIVLSDHGGGRAERMRDRPASLAGAETYRMRLIARKR